MQQRRRISTAAGGSSASCASSPGGGAARRFRFPQLDIRPTPDRVRETLFNWLQTRIEGAHCLDLYAGSGALGLEALSRGAASVVFVEQQRAAVKALRALLRDWQASGASVVCDEAQHYLAAARQPAAARCAAAASTWCFSIRRTTSGELPRGARRHWRAAGWRPSARIYVEQHAAMSRCRRLPAGWRELRAGTAGEVRYHLFAAEQSGTRQGSISMRSTAVYPGTFDPLTRGHEDIARRAASIFGRVVVAVAANPNKAPLFNVEERVELARAVLADLTNVEVTGYTG